MITTVAWFLVTALQAGNAVSYSPPLPTNYECQKLRSSVIRENPKAKKPFCVRLKTVEQKK